MRTNNNYELGTAIKIRVNNGLLVDADNIFILECSFRYGNYAFLTDLFGKSAGYLIWARVNKESVDRFFRTGKIPRYSYEWDEGEYNLLIDVVLDKKYSEYMMLQIKKIIRSMDNVLYVKKTKLVYYSFSTREKKLNYNDAVLAQENYLKKKRI